MVKRHASIDAQEENLHLNKKISNLYPNKKLKSIRAQMKIQQMAFMLIAIVVFFALAGLFVLSIKMADLRKSATLLDEQNAQLLVTKLANSPEFSCGESFGSQQTHCIDADKAMIVRENIAKYRNFWGDVSNIELRIIYPEIPETMCELGNYPNCNVIRIKSGKVIGTYAENFVSVCKKEQITGETSYYNKCELGKLLISYEEVK